MSIIIRSHYVVVEKSGRICRANRTGWSDWEHADLVKVTAVKRYREHRRRPNEYNIL